MEEGIALYDGGIAGECGAASIAGVRKLIEGFEGFVGDGLVGERQEAFGGLSFGRVRRWKAETDAFGELHLLAGVPASIVEHDGDDLVVVGADSISETPETPPQLLTAVDTLSDSIVPVAK